MSTKKNKPPLALDMDFSEALTRFAKVDPKEVAEKTNTKHRVKTLAKKAK